MNEIRIVRKRKNRLFSKKFDRSMLSLAYKLRALFINQLMRKKFIFIKQNDFVEHNFINVLILFLQTMSSRFKPDPYLERGKLINPFKLDHSNEKCKFQDIFFHASIFCDKHFFFHFNCYEKRVHSMTCMSMYFAHSAKKNALCQICLAN